VAQSQSGRFFDGAQHDLGLLGIEAGPQSFEVPTATVAVNRAPVTELFTGGVDAATITTANSIFTFLSGSPEFDDDVFYPVPSPQHTARSMLVVSDSTSRYGRTDGLNTPSMSASVYVRFASVAPAGTSIFLRWTDSTGTQTVTLLLSTTGRIVAQDTASSPIAATNIAGHAVVANNWYRVDVLVEKGAGTGRLQYRICDVNAGDTNTPITTPYDSGATLDLGANNIDRIYAGGVINGVARNGDWNLSILRFDSTRTAFFDLYQAPPVPVISKGAWVVAVGQASEADTAQAVTPRRTYTLGQPSEADTAQTITVRKVRTLGQCSESDTAQALTSRKTVHLDEVVVGGDPFNRADTTPIDDAGAGLGAGWATTRYFITNNKASRGSSGSDVARFLTDLGTLDHWVEAQVVGTPGVANTFYSVIDARADAAFDNVVFGYIEPGGGQAVIAAQQGGSFFGVLGSTGGPYDLTGTYTLRLEVQGTTARLYHNGVLGHTQDISALTNLGTFGGLNTQGGGAPPWDNFRVGYMDVPSEADTAQPITPRRTYTLGQASETDTAQDITPVMGTVDVNIDVPPATLVLAGVSASLSGTGSAIIIVPPGDQAWEWSVAVNGGEFVDPPYEFTDTNDTNLNIVGIAPTITVAEAKFIDVDPAVETDTAQSITARKTRSIGQASELDSAFAPTSRKTKAIGQSSETDTAQPITVRRSVTVGQAAETDTAQAITARKVKLLGQASETDSAQALTHRKTVTLAQASETDTAQAITARRTRTVAVGQASETDSAQAITYPFRRLIGQASETDLAQPIQSQGNKLIPVVQASESDSAQTITVRKARTLGQASESDSAGSLTVRQAHSVGQAAEADTAFGITARKTKLIGLAVENDSATSVTLVRGVTVGQAVETDSAQTITWSPKIRLVGQALEADTALPIRARLLFQHVHVDLEVLVPDCCLTVLVPGLTLTMVEPPDVTLSVLVPRVSLTVLTHDPELVEV
jgi:hypothetical protein